MQAKKIFFSKFVVLAVVALVFFIGGWKLRSRDFGAASVNSAKSIALRLSGYHYTSPLLTCDSNPNQQSARLNGLKNNLQTAVDQEIKNKNITIASVYFRDLKNGSQININSDEKFYPSSLRKVPLMIALLKVVESNPGILDKTVIAYRDPDQNGSQEIKPADFARTGKNYTLSDLLDKMIKYSDNNAALVFTNLLGIDTIKTIYNNLQIPFVISNPNSSSTADIDFMTANKFAFFFRVLYNSTYLSGELSDRALKLLTTTDFKQGLVAGVPAGTEVAHKYGLTSLGDKQGNITTRELHDCGIVYYPNNPYLICVMTKSMADIPSIEKSIANISAAAYQEFDSSLKK